MISLTAGLALALSVGSLTFVDEPHGSNAAGAQTDIVMSSTAGDTVASQAKPTILAQYDPCPGGRCR
jgi:hypothetical protein